MTKFRSGEVKQDRQPDCPPPPAGIEDAEFPIHELKLSATNLYRVHRRVRGPIHYNRRSVSSTVFRFDAPNDEYGVLYASESFDVCMAETLMRDRFQGIDISVPHIIEESAITERSIATLGFDDSRSLRLADLTQPLWHLGFDARVVSTSDYSIPNLWSKGLHDNKLQLDGIYFRSRFGNDMSVAIFSDRAKLVQRGQSMPLLNHPDLPEFLDRFQIGIADPDGSHWRAAGI